MALILADENFPLPGVEELRRLGHDVLTMHEIGKANLSIPDDEVLKISIDLNRVLITVNRKHFVKLHKINSNHKGIIVCSFDPDFIGQANKIHNAIISIGSNLDTQLIKINLK